MTRWETRALLACELVVLGVVFWLTVPDGLTRAFIGLLALSSIGLCSMIAMLVRAFFGIRLDPMLSVALLVVCAFVCMLLMWQIVDGCYLHHGVCS